MALNEVAKVDISLQTTFASQAGFGTPIFITSHRSFLGRVNEYADLTAVAVDFATDSNVYRAATALFANTPKPQKLKVGRRVADATLIPTTTTQTDVVSFKLTVNDNDNGIVSYTVGASETIENVVDGLIAAFGALGNNADLAAHVTLTKVGSGAGASLLVSNILSSDVFIVNTFEKMTDSYASTESGADAMTAIVTEDSDFFFVTAEQDTVFRSELATVCEASDLMFVQARSTTAELDAASGATPTVERAVTLWHHDADKFPELQWIGVNAVYDQDKQSVTWSGSKLSLFSNSKDPRTGNALTSGQITNLLSYGYNMVVPVGKVPVVRPGKVEGGEWIDTIHGRSTMTARIQEKVASLIINQHGGKIPYTAKGIAQMDGALVGALQPFKDSGFLEDFTTNPPLISSISAAQKQTRQLTGLAFTAFIAGAIHSGEFPGTLTISE